MDASMWVAKTGLDAQQTRMTVISNNLANVNTTGYKRDRAVFEDLLYQRLVQAGGQTSANTSAPTGMMLGTGTKVVATEKMHAQGNMVMTQNALDVAVSGDGFFQINMPNGQLAYTRDGSFQISGFRSFQFPKSNRTILRGSHGQFAIATCGNGGDRAAATFPGGQLTFF